MVKNLLLPMLGVALFIVFVGLFMKKAPSLNLNQYLPTPSPSQVQTMTIDGKDIQVEVANTEAAREKGLGGRASLPADNGMLFVFDSKQVLPIFWMKDMLIPLDMIWISGNKIVKMDKNILAPAAGTSDAKLKKISPNQPIDYVLEVNGGFSDTNNIKVGDRVIIPQL